MLTLSQYRQMIEPVEQRTTELRISLNSFSPLVQLAKPRRETFKEYCFSNNLKRPSCEIVPYLEKYNSSRKGLLMGHQIKEFLLKNLHHNKHKDFYMSGIVQAYLDVCLALSVADYCVRDMGQEFDYSEYLATATDSINFCFDNIEPFQALSSLPVLDGFQNVLTGMVSMAKDVEESRNIAHTRISSAFKILKMWQEQKISYVSEYDVLIERIDTMEKEEKIKTEKFLLTRLVVVSRHKTEFLQEEIEQAELIYSNISEETFKQFKPKEAELPTVEEVRQYLNQQRANTRKTSFDDL